MKLNNHSFELHQERIDKHHTLCLLIHTSSCPYVFILLKRVLLLNMIIVWLASVVQLSLTYTHVFDEARMNYHQAFYLVNNRLISVVSNTEASTGGVLREKGVLRNFTKFTGNHQCQSLLFN